VVGVLPEPGPDGVPPAEDPHAAPATKAAARSAAVVTRRIMKAACRELRTRRSRGSLVAVPGDSMTELDARAPVAGTVVGLRNHGLTITGTSLDVIFDRVGAAIVPAVPME
jgi:hypothetical protein